MNRYRIESEGLEDVEVERKTEARGEARKRLGQGRSSVIVKLERDGREQIAGLYGIQVNGALTELEDAGTGAAMIPLEQRIATLLPKLRDCPPRLKQLYPELAPLNAVAAGPRLRPSGLASRLLNHSIERLTATHSSSILIL